MARDHNKEKEYKRLRELGCSEKYLDWRLGKENRPPIDQGDNADSSRKEPPKNLNGTLRLWSSWGLFCFWVAGLLAW